MENNRNYLLAIALSVLVLVGWQFLYVSPKIERERAATEAQSQLQQPETAAGTAQPSTGAPDGSALPSGSSNQSTLPGHETAAAAASQSRDALVASTGRVRIDTPSLSGSINLVGARFDDLKLNGYHETVDDSSPRIELLNPAGAANGYFVELGYIGNDASGPAPGPETEWTVESGDELTQATPVVLAWDNGQGLTFRRTISVDENYMFVVVDSIANSGSAAVSVAPYGRVTRLFKPNTRSVYVLHEGLIGYVGEEGLQEIDYSDVEESKIIPAAKATSGWMGITDKYWAAALVPPQGRAFDTRFAYFEGGRPRYQSDYNSDPVTIAPGGSEEIKNLVFAGAKRVAEIQAYQESYSIPQFDLLIDWGWFYFITKPMFWLIDFFFRMFGNFGVSILVTTVVVKLIFFPLANKSYKSMANMKKLQPKMAELKEKHGDDKMALQKEMMELYKKEKVNPVAGCWPVLLQIPVFFSLYKVLYVTIEMRHAPFFGWIQDLSAPDPTSIFNLFGLLPYDVPSMLMIGVWPLIMGITMFLQMQMNPTPPDPTQQMIFRWMPVIFTFMLATFPAGLVIYWAWNNTLSIIQQGVIMKRQGAKIELWDNLMSLFKRKPKPAE